MKKRLQYLILPLVTLILEVIPYGAVCNFAYPAEDGSIKQLRELYSYFDLTPFGYANFAPLITAIITCVIILLVAIYCLTGKQSWAIFARSALCIGVLISLCPLLLGIDYFSIVGALISASLIAELYLIHQLITASANST
jgi:hypothetical protein